MTPKYYTMLHSQDGTTLAHDNADHVHAWVSCWLKLACDEPVQPWSTRRLDHDGIGRKGMRCDMGGCGAIIVAA